MNKLPKVGYFLFRLLFLYGAGYYFFTGRSIEALLMLIILQLIYIEMAIREPYLSEKEKKG